MTRKQAKPFRFLLWDFNFRMTNVMSGMRTILTVTLVAAIHLLSFAGVVPACVRYHNFLRAVVSS